MVWLELLVFFCQLLFMASRGLHPAYLSLIYSYTKLIRRELQKSRESFFHDYIIPLYIHIVSL